MPLSSSALSPLHSRSRSNLTDMTSEEDPQEGDRPRIASPSRFSRTEIYFLAGWCIFCLKITRDSILLMDAGQRSASFYEAFLYYNPLLMMAMMVWLWGVNLWGFSHFRINYAKIFELEPGYLTHIGIWKFASWMTALILTSLTAYLYFYAQKELEVATTQPVLIYFVFPLFLAFPFDVFYATSRFYFLNTLKRLALPIQPISFADFFVADVLTSMSKVLSDVERSVCTMYYHPLPGDETCGNHSVWIPFILALPYFFRLCQCLRQYSDARDKSCLFNALKYATSFPVVFLSAIKYHIALQVWEDFYRPLWLLSSVLNSGFSFYWDISRDWDLSLFSFNMKPKYAGLRPILVFSPRWVYYWAIASNFVLRCAWTYKLSAHLRHNHLTVFAFSGLEMLRRFQWIFFRVENEHNKIMARSSSPQADEAELKLLTASV